VGRRGRKRQLDLESEYWKPLQSGVGTVAACKLLGIGRKTRLPMASGERWAVAGTAGRVGPLRPVPVPARAAADRHPAGPRARRAGDRPRLHPAALAEGGLRPALKTLARRSAVPVRLDVGVEGRLPEPIELATYYVVAEALTNAAKHASAAVVEVQVQTLGGVLHVHVGDDGRGGADLTRGTGLVGLTDRVEALGGRLVLHSPPGAGTTMQVRLPLTAPDAPRSPAAVIGRTDDTGHDPAAEPGPSDPARGR
jgi:hypothetical protein